MRYLAMCLAVLAMTGPALSAECRKLAVAAGICAEAGLRFATPAPKDPAAGPRLIDMRLDTPDHGAVTVTYIANAADQALGTLTGYRSLYLEQLESKGATLAELYEFRHRGAPGLAQQFIALHPGPGDRQFWGVAIGVEVEDGLVMVLITSDREAGSALRAEWTVSALDALHPRTAK